MGDSIIILLSDIFFDLQKQNKDPYIIVKLDVPCKILFELYERLSKIDVPKIETSPEDKKLAYWQIAKRFYTDELSCVKASKSSYMIDLITSNS